MRLQGVHALAAFFNLVIVGRGAGRTAYYILNKG